MKTKYTSKSLPTPVKDTEFINHYVRDFEFIETIIVKKSDIQKKQHLTFDNCVFHQGIVFEPLDNKMKLVDATFGDCIFNSSFNLDEVFSSWTKNNIGKLSFGNCNFLNGFKSSKAVHKKIQIDSLMLSECISSEFIFSWDLKINYLSLQNISGNVEIESEILETSISYDDSIKEYYENLFEKKQFSGDWYDFLEIERNIHFRPEYYEKISIYQFFDEKVFQSEIALMNIDLWLDLYNSKDNPGNVIVDGTYYKVSVYGPIKNLELSRVFSQNINVHGVSKSEEVKFENVHPLTKESQFIISSSNLENCSFFNVDFEAFKFLSIYKSNIQSSFFSQCTFPKKIYSFDVDDMNREDNLAKYDSYKQMKSALLKSNNLPEALRMHSRMYNHYSKLKGIGVWDRFILFFNLISNKYGISWSRGVLFTAIIGGFGFWGYTCFLEIPLTGLSSIIKHYLLFLYPAHSFDFMKEYKPNEWAYIIDFISRIFVGYGYYQTIQAFRKFGRL